MEKLVGRNVRNSINLSYGRFYSKQNQKKIHRKSLVAVVSSRLPPGHRPYRQALLAGQPQLLSSSPPPQPPHPSMSCPSVGSCSLLACRFDRSPAIEALLACRARPMVPPLPHSLLFSAHLLATFSLLFTLAWATCLKSSDVGRPVPARRVSFVFFRAVVSFLGCARVFFVLDSCF
ncbi:AAEL004149-PA [Aedes aegypti]|uniref:AAEL004149-PA n=1 Tax=Aedes aegypti TaxID=7159 RepID=Q0IFQ9_AEDAE|nr:AAEL004149-PA [Aedes aegypti]